MDALIRPMRNTAAELDRVDRLLTTAYESPSRRRELSLYLSVQPDGWYVIAEDDRIVAAAGAVAYGRFCWLGLVATDPDRRGLGLATRLSSHLIDWARQRGCRTVALDASDAGRAVYARLGFRVVGYTAEMEVPKPLPGAARPVHLDQDSRISGALLDLDRRAFGGDRTALLRGLARQGRRVWHAPDHDGRPAGYLTAGEGLLGPGCATSAAVACDLVQAACQGGSGQRLLLPADSGYLAALLRLGLRERRRLAHMRLGDLTLPGERSQLLAQASFATG
jgi:GNAT superfamily N-acetyltransferase